MSETKAHNLDPESVRKTVERARLKQGIRHARCMRCKTPVAQHQAQNGRIMCPNPSGDVPRGGTL